MNRKHTLAIVLCGFTLTLCAGAFGKEDYRTKLGFQLGTIRTNHSNEMGWLLGGRTGRFFGTSNVYIGLAGNYGAPTGKNPSYDWMGYGGLLVGYEGWFSKGVGYELSVLGGYGEGRFRTTTPELRQMSYFVVEPNIGISIPLGLGWRLTFVTSYIHMTEATNFSGTTLSMRFEFKSETSTKPIND